VPPLQNLCDFGICRKIILNQNSTADKDFSENKNDILGKKVL